MKKDELAIIIVNWNSYDDTAACLISLRTLTYASFQIIVVDNGSKDDSGQRLKKEFDHIILLENEINEGFTGGNNRGIAYALKSNFEYIMLLNNDTIVTPGFIQPMLAIFNLNESIGAVQPKILFESERDIIWNGGTGFSQWGHYPYTLGTGKKNAAFGNQVGEIPWITGCCFLVKCAVVRDIGVLDNDFFIYFEDTDWSLRMREAGYQLYYQPDSKIYHKVGQSDRNRSSEGEGNLSPFAHYVTVRNHLYLWKKHAKGLFIVTGFLFQCFKLLAYTLYFLARFRFTKLRKTYLGFVHGMSKRH